MPLLLSRDEMTARLSPERRSELREIANGDWDVDVLEAAADREIEALDALDAAESRIAELEAALRRLSEPSSELHDVGHVQRFAREALEQTTNKELK